MKVVNLKNRETESLFLQGGCKISMLTLSVDEWDRCCEIQSLDSISWEAGEVNLISSAQGAYQCESN